MGRYRGEPQDQGVQLGLPLSVTETKFAGVPKAAAAHAPDRRKALGAFYTPPAMAEVLTDWAVRTPQDRVLDPSFGGLVFLAAARDRLRALGVAERKIAEQLYGIDLDEKAHAVLDRDLGAWIDSRNLLNRDFFEVRPAELPAFDAVVGNPPYIRYQEFNGAGERARQLAAEAGVSLTRLASSWAPFVVHGTGFVKEGGRYAQVLPAEILHAQYAREIVEFLRREFGRIRVAVFDERVFPGALEDVVLLFAEGRGASGLADVELISCATVADVEHGLAARPRAGSPRQPHGQELLAQLLPEDTQELYVRLSKADGIHPLGELGSVDIGVVTGANEFFVLTQADVDHLPSELLRPAVCKAAHVTGARITAKDHRALLDRGQRALMFAVTPGTPRKLLRRAKRHIAGGEAAGFHQRYKCRIRNPWWELPLPDAPPDLLLTYCSNEHPRLTLNSAKVLNTNTIHGVRLSGRRNAKALAAGFYNSLTLLSAELVGRSYGGGVLKLEPSEAEALLVPPIPSDVAKLLPGVDRAVRDRDLEATLDIVDAAVLRPLGLTDADIKSLRLGRERLQGRRRRRGRAAR